MFDANSGLGTGVTITVAGTAVCTGLTVTGPAGKNMIFSLSGNPTWAGALSFTSNNAVNRILISSSVIGTARTIAMGAAGTMTASNIDFMDISVTGTNTPVTGTLLGDCLGNAGITFQTPATQTWQGTSGGNYSDVTKWTSRVPLPQDNVLISSAFIAAQTITVDMPRAGRDIDASGSTGAVSFRWDSLSSLTTFGSVAMAANMVNVYGTSTFWNLRGRSSHTITSNGLVWGAAGSAVRLNVSAVGGTYTIQDAFVDTTNGSPSQISLSSGTLTFAANVTVGTLVITGGTFNGGSGVVTGSANGGFGANIFNFSGGTVNAANTTFKFSPNAGATSQGFAGNGNTFGTLDTTNSGTSPILISGSNTFGTIRITAPKMVTFTAGTTTTVSSLIAVGSAGNLITLNSSTPGSTWTIRDLSGTNTCDYLVLQDSTATGGATFIAGNHSANVSNNTGWIFTTTAPPAANVISVSRAGAVLVRPVVDWRWVLCKSSDMTEITELAVHDRSLQVQLDNQGKASGWTHLLDPNSKLIVPHQTALRLDRNEESVWSGEIWQANDDSSSGTDKCSITAFGWFNALGGSGDNGRLVHTGAEFQAMLAAPNGVLWVAQNGAYVPLGIDGATQLAYSASQFPQTTDAAIIFDLLNRANIDAPTLITPGNVYGTPFQRNLTLQRFQNVGQEILQLVNTESGVDFEIDSVTREMNLWAAGASGTPLIGTGRGADRGAGTLFSYPGNCISASRSRDGTKTQNRFEIIGQYGVGRGDDVGSQATNGLLEGTQSLSEVVDPNILIAYAQAQILVMSQPWTIITFTPRAVTAEDSNAPGVPRPFDDYDLGDIVYAQINRGSMQVGIPNPQPVRVFGFTINIDDDGIEKVSQIQTSYQGI